MKIKRFLGVSLFLLLVTASSSFSNDSSFTFTVENLYDHFGKNYTIKQFFFEARQQAQWLSEKCKKGEESCRKGLEEFGKPYSGWNNIKGFTPITEIVEAKTGMIIVHPNPKLQKIVNVPNLDKKFKDHRGILVIVEGFAKFRRNGKWAWFAQYTTWMRSETQLQEPLFNINVVVDVPGTTYQIHHVMPFRATSTEDIETKIKLIEEQTERWGRK